MAGRHGNKCNFRNNACRGMPFDENGEPVDIVLNPWRPFAYECGTDTRNAFGGQRMGWAGK